MRFNRQAVTALQLLCVVHSAQAGPLKWSAVVFRRADNPANSVVHHDDQTDIPTTTPRPSLETIANPTNMFPHSLVTATQNDMESASATSIGLTLIPLDGKGTTTTTTTSQPEVSEPAASQPASEVLSTDTKEPAVTSTGSLAAPTSATQPTSTELGSSIDVTAPGTEASSFTSELKPTTKDLATSTDVNPGTPASTSRESLPQSTTNVETVETTSDPVTTAPNVGSTDVARSSLETSAPADETTSSPASTLDSSAGLSYSLTPVVTAASSTTQLPFSKNVTRPESTTGPNEPPVSSLNPSTLTSNLVTKSQPLTLTTSLGQSIGSLNSTAMVSISRVNSTARASPPTALSSVSLPSLTSSLPLVSSETAPAASPPAAGEPTSPTPTTTPTIVTMTTSSTNFVTVSPTGAVNPNIPTAITSLPTGTTTVAADIYASNLAQAKDLNKLYSTLTPDSACTGQQGACIDGKVAICDNGVFKLTACANPKFKCFALPMTNVQGASIGCNDPAYAEGILGGSAGGGGASTESPNQTSQPAPESPSRPIVTRTRVVTVTDGPSEPTSEAPLPPILPTTTAQEVAPDPVVTTSEQAPAPTLPLSSQPAMITITQSIQQPNEEPQPTQTAGRDSPSSSPQYDEPPAPNPTSLVLVPLDGPPSTSSPTAAATEAVGNSDAGEGVARSTQFNNGTPTVSVYFTVTVTEKERETVTLIVPN